MENTIPPAPVSEPFITQVPVPAVPINPPPEQPKKNRLWIILILAFLLLGGGVGAYFFLTQETPTEEVFESAPDIAPIATGSEMVGTGTETPLMTTGGTEVATDIQKVFKVQTYYKNADGSYTYYSYGSAILIGEKQILTNAHVVMGRDDLPTGKYNLCITKDGVEQPICVTALKLLKYDRLKDIALLEVLSDVSLGTPLELIDRKLSLGETIKVLGYPSNGGETLSFTEGKMSGSEKGYYKIDANIDHGNSGGGAFDKDDIFVGMPYIAQTGLTTMGYIIPVKMIQDFLSGIGDITEYTMDESAFAQYVDGANQLMTAESVENDFFTFDGYKEAGFTLKGANIDANGYGEYTFLSETQNTIITVTVPYIQGSEYYVFKGDTSKLDDEFEQVDVSYDMEKSGKKLDQLIAVSGLKKTNGTIDKNYALYGYKLDGITYMIITQARNAEKKDFENADSLFWENLTIKKTNVSINDRNINIHSGSFTLPKGAYAGKKCGEKCMYEIALNPTLKMTYAPSTLAIENIEDVTLDEYVEKMNSYMGKYIESGDFTMEVRKNSNDESYIFSRTKDDEGNTEIEGIFFAKENEYKYIQHHFDLIIKESESDWESVFEMVIDSVSIDAMSPFSGNSTEESSKTPAETYTVPTDMNEAVQSEYEDTENAPTSTEADIQVVPTITPSSSPKTEIKDINYCETTFEGVTYKLDPCNINETMNPSEGDKSFEYKIIPSDSDASYAYSVYGYGEGFPTYGILGGTSGGARGTVDQNPFFSSKNLKQGSYDGYLKIKITGSNGASARELRLMIKLNVSAPIPTNEIDYCTTTLEGINYTLDKCTLDETMSLSEGDKSFSYKVTPSDLDASYSYSDGAQGLPDYAVGGNTSGGASGIIYNDLFFRADSLKPGTYDGYLIVGITGDNSASARSLRMKIHLTVTE